MPRKFFTLSSNFLNNPLTYQITGPNGFSQTYTGVTNSTYSIDLTIGSSTSPLEDGNYTITVTDQCGHTVTRNYGLVTTAPPITSVNTDVGCSLGSINIAVNAPAGILFSSAELVSHPASYSGPSVATIGSTSNYETFNIVPNKSVLAMNDVPAGTYVFKITDECGREYTHTVTKTSGLSHGNTDVSLVRNCSSFAVNMNITGSPTYDDKYFLQRFETTTNAWETVTALNNNLLNGTFTQEGQYRVLKRFTSKRWKVDPGVFWYASTLDCEAIIYEFDYSSDQLGFDKMYSFECNDGTYDLYISAKDGAEPFTFSLVEKQDDNSFIPISPSTSNASSAVFLGLAPGVYKARTTDACLNTKEIWVDLSLIGLPEVQASQICDQQDGSLLVPNIEYLKYEWTKDGNATVLSTQSELKFTPFNLATDAGVYSVRIYSDLPNSCMDKTISFTIPNALDQPNAGNDVDNIEVCDSKIIINLDEYLAPNAETTGSWTEITPSNGNLIGSIWSPMTAGSGVYQFLYTVNGLCSGQDTAIYTIRVDECGVCFVGPALSSNSNLSSKHGITLLNRAGSDNGNWPMIRNSAHTVLESNSKGLVITRLSTAELANIASPVEGMMVYDTTEKCLKIYTGTDWVCFKTPACP